MCTTVTMHTTNQHHFLARNMDFVDLPIDYDVVVLPRRYRWLNQQENRYITNRYGIIGMGVEGENTHIGLFDGMNEHGLMGVIHYFEGFAEFQTEKQRNRLNLAANDLLLFILSQFTSTSQITQQIRNINLIAQEIEFLGTVPPIHWIFTDRQYNTIVIESTKDGVNVYNNPIGAFSNSPDFRWHLINLNLYTSLSPSDPGETIWGDYNLVRSPEMVSGVYGIPGDYSSPSRFVRAAYLRNHIEEAETELDGLRNAMKVLEYCAVARGAELEDNQPSYTLYTSAMCSESETYYYQTYNNMQINAVQLSNEDLDAQDVKHFPISQEQSIFYQNRTK
ncbi:MULTISPECIES: choloylglycine hydrolase family protein [Cytobacillus]|uniref:Choloylglycine hydrolase family protein n=1 Tax=Cytobacillus stercorigallinarum TaxID=2762240 RepID=A0ABR8QLG0_9BACI|nr:choloylglycine hydrolase family protein [Cytobacillus stercorigallinarum]MBD7936312.1 choloylglycine hydrolase family protein [Cytobacillus stercorigallinarum]